MDAAAARLSRSVVVGCQLPGRLGAPAFETRCLAQALATRFSHVIYLISALLWLRIFTAYQDAKVPWWFPAFKLRVLVAWLSDRVSEPYDLQNAFFQLATRDPVLRLPLRPILLLGLSPALPSTMPAGLFQRAKFENRVLSALSIHPGSCAEAFDVELLLVVAKLKLTLCHLTYSSNHSPALVSYNLRHNQDHGSH